MGSLIDRFVGKEGERRLHDVLLSCPLVANLTALAWALKPHLSLIDLVPGDVLIQQDASDNDVYLILLGSFKVLINGRQVAVRGPGQHVGEMVDFVHGFKI